MFIGNVLCFRLIGQPDVIAAVSFDTSNLEGCVANLPESFKLQRPRSLIPFQANQDSFAFRMAPYNMWDEDDDCEVVLRRDMVVSVSQLPQQFKNSYMETITKIALPGTMM